MKRTVPWAGHRTRVLAAMLAAAVVAAVVVAVLAVTGETSRADTSSKAPIVIGSTSDQTGFIAQGAGLPWSRAVNVWVKWINDKGGILGHPVVVLNEDTKSEAATGARVMNELLGNPKVVAVVHGGDDTGDAAAIATATAPVIGGANDEDLGWSNPNVFPASTTANVVEEAIGILGAESSPQRPDGAVLLFQAPQGAEGIAGEVIPPMQAGAEQAGGAIVDTASIASVAADYAALCRAAQAMQVGWITVIDLPAKLTSLAKACEQIGYKPSWVGLPPIGDAAEWLQVTALDGIKFVLPNTLYSGETPAAREFRQAVAKYDPDLLTRPYFGETSIMAWAAMQLVAKAIEQAHPQGAEVTRSDVYRGLYSLKDETLGGLTPPLTFHRGKPGPVSCYFTAQIKSGQFVATSATPVCTLRDAARIVSP